MNRKRMIIRILAVLYIVLLTAMFLCACTRREPIIDAEAVEEAGNPECEAETDSDRDVENEAELTENKSEETEKPVEDSTKFLTENLIRTISEENLYASILDYQENGRKEWATLLRKAETEGEVFYGNLYVVAAVQEEEAYLLFNPFDWGGVLFWNGERVLLPSPISMQYGEPEMVAGDFDGDESTELILIQLEEHGSGVMVEGLSVFDRKEEEIRMAHLEKEVYLDVLQAYDPESEAVFRDIVEMEVIGNHLVVKATGGFVEEGHITPDYESAQVLSCEILYDGEKFAAGDVWEPVEAPVKVKGIYVSGATAGSSRMDELIRLLDETDLNAMVIDVKTDDGKITFHLEDDRVKQMENYSYDIRDVQEFMFNLKKHGIYTIARIVCFKDPTLAAFDSNLALMNEGSPVSERDGVAWVNPCKEEVWDYLCSVGEKAIEAGFDEIQFDYVRFPLSKASYSAEYGIDLDTYTRVQVLDDFFSYVAERFHEKGILFGADVFGAILNSELDKKSTGQDYTFMGSKLDVLSAMVYPSHYANGFFELSVPDAYPYECVSGAMQQSIEMLAGVPEEERAIVRPWLQCFTATWVEGHIPYTSEELKKQIQAVYDAGYEEWILWNASNRYEKVYRPVQSRQ